LRGGQVEVTELDNQSDWTHHEIPHPLRLSLAIAVPPALTLAGVAPNSGASTMSQFGAKGAHANPSVEGRKEQHGDGKESAKSRRHGPAEQGREASLPFFISLDPEWYRIPE
jgi:hypothetical protein